MGHIDERTERLIVRKLDGDLSLEEEHQLNKLLIREPQSRQLLDSYADQDRWAASVLAEEVGTAAVPDLEEVTSGAPPFSPPRRRTSWTASSAAGLMVACLAMFALLWEPVFQPIHRTSDTVANLAGNAAVALPVARGEEFQTLPAHLALPQTKEQELARQFIAVYDEKAGRYYVLEVRQVRTRISLVSGDF